VRRIVEAVQGTPARRNSAGSLVIQGSQRLGRVITIIPAAAVLEPPAFAALAVAIALTDLVRTAMLAYDVSAVRLLTAGQDPREVSESHLGAKLVVGTAGSLIILVLAWVVYGAQSFALALVATVGTIPAGIASLLLVRRQVRFELGSAIRLVTLGSTIGAVLAIAGVVITRQAIAVAAGLTIGDIFIFASLASEMRGWRLAPLARIAEVIRRAGTLLAMQLSYIGQFRIGTVILGALGTSVAVGEYTVASRIAEGLVILAAALTASSLPLMGLTFAREGTPAVGRVAMRTYGLALMAATPIVAVLAISAPIWIALLFPRYPGAAQVFVPVGLTVVVFFASSQTTAFLNASHRDKLAAVSAAAGLVAAAVGSLGLVAFGAFGVAIGRLLGECTRLSVETVAVMRAHPSLGPAMARAWLTMTPAIAAIASPLVFGWSAPVAVVGALAVTGAVGLTAHGLRTALVT
jgi:O-antigen/teichoic acid export membrane protein